MVLHSILLGECQFAFTKVAGEGSINVLPDFTLSSVSFNLLSVSSLNKIHNCCVKSFPCHCTFQDLKIGQMIGGGGGDGNGLYILELINKESKALLYSLQ